MPKTEITALTTLLQEVAVQLQQAAQYYAERVVSPNDRLVQRPDREVEQVCAACGLPIVGERTSGWLANSMGSPVCHYDFIGCVEAAQAMCTLAFETIRYGVAFPLHDS